MAAAADATDKVEPADSEQDEEEDVYEVERIIDVREEQGEILYRVRWKNYCSDDDTWEPEAHLEDCHEVLLTFKRNIVEAKAKKEAEAKKIVKPLPMKSEVFDADSDSDSDKDRPAPLPVKKKKKKKIREEDESPPKEKKKKKEKRKEEVRPQPAPESDEEEEDKKVPTPPSPTNENKADSKKRLMDSNEEDDELVPSKKQKKEKVKEVKKDKKEKAEDGKKKKGKKEKKIETSDDEAAAPLEDDLSEDPSEPQVDDTGKSSDKVRLDDKSKEKRGKWEVKLQGIKDIFFDKKVKKTDVSLKESSLQKLKSLTSKGKEESAPHSDSSDSSALHKKVKSKGQESASAPVKAMPSSASSVPAVSSSSKVKEDEVAKEEVAGSKDSPGSANLFEKFLLNCEAKDRAPRRQPAPEKSIAKPTKVIGKIEKIPKASKESPAQKAESEKTEKSKQSDASRPSQSYGFSLDSDEREAEETTVKPRPGDDSRERRERQEEPQRPSWEKRTPTDDKKKRREDSEPRLFMACDENQEVQETPEGADKSEKGQATLSLGMDLNLDWMTLDDFQKHLNGEDEILSGPPLSPSELRDAVKCGDYMAVKLALNSKEDYNLDQEACTIGGKGSFEGERSLIEETSLSDALRLTSNFDNARNQEGTTRIEDNILQHLDCLKDKVEEMACYPDDGNAQQMTLSDHKNDGNAACNSAAKQHSEGYKDQRQSEGALSGEMSLDTEWILTMEHDKTEVTSISDKHCSPDESNDETDDVVADHLDGNDIDSSELDTKELAKRQLRHCRKTFEKKEPVRSSQRTCKKVLNITPCPEDEEKKEPAKKHFCLYCQTAFTQLTKHLEKKHSLETDVAHAIHFPKGSKLRQTLLDQIRNKGDYEHNCHVLKSGRGEIVTKKQANNPAISVRDFLPCQHCFAFYRKTDLWRHERSCKARKGDQKPSEGTSRVHSAASRLLPMSELLTGGCEEIVHIMHQDDISRHIRNDPLICKYGNALAVKYDHDKSQFAYIAQKMRELGRFIVAVNELDNSVKYLHEICQPSKFALAVEGAKKASGFDPDSNKFKTVSLVSKIGYSLKRAAEIAFGESRMTEDSESESEVKKFIHLLDTKWSECFSRKALSSSVKIEIKKVDVSTLTEDLMKLHRFIAKEEDEARKDLKESPSLLTWKKLSEATLADVCLFNRGRVGNIGRLLLQTYNCRKSNATSMLSAEHVRKSTKLELELRAFFTRLELEGQFGRNMLVLLTEKMVLSIDLLIDKRHQVGVSTTNPYLFARNEGPSFIRGLDCFRRAAVECGVKNPDALLSSSIREQVATCWQLLSLNQRELDQVAQLLGLNSQECCRLSENASQLQDVSRELIKMEPTLPSSSPTTANDGTTQKTPVKRKPWSEEEQAAVKRYLNEYITNMKVPGKKQCNACIAAEPNLSERSWTDVKNYVHNTLQTLRRRITQGKSEGNPKSPSAEVQTSIKQDLEDTSVVCSLTTVNPDDFNSSCLVTMAPPTNMRDSSTPFSHEMTTSYASLCSTSSNILHSSQSLISSFTPLNATDTQVVPTFTPHNTTNALMPPPYTSESNHLMPLSSSFTQNMTVMSSVYTSHDTAALPMIPAFSSLNAPVTSMIPTYTTLSTPSASMMPPFSSLNDRSRPVVSSFTALNHTDSTAYPTGPPRIPTTAQVVPTNLGPSVPDRAPMAQKSSPTATAESAKRPKRNKRLWSEEEQAAVRRQFGDFSKLAKVPGKKDCDACLAAEPALSSRTWREVKYFVHNSIQSLKRKGHVVSAKETGEGEAETLTSTTDWDGPVYLSL